MNICVKYSYTQRVLIIKRLTWIESHYLCVRCKQIAFFLLFFDFNGLKPELEDEKRAKLNENEREMNNESEYKLIESVQYCWNVALVCIVVLLFLLWFFLLICHFLLFHIVACRLCFKWRMIRLYMLNVSWFFFIFMCSFCENSFLVCVSRS